MLLTLVQGVACQRANWKAVHKTECRGRAENGHLYRSPWVIHPDPAWPKERIGQAKQRFLTEFIFEVQAIAIRGLLLQQALKDDGDLDIETWDALIGESFVAMTLDFRSGEHKLLHQNLGVQDVDVIPWSTVGPEAVVRATKAKLIMMRPAYCVAAAVVSEGHTEKPHIYSPYEMAVFTIDIPTLHTHKIAGQTLGEAVKSLQHAVERGHGQAIKQHKHGVPVFI